MLTQSKAQSLKDKAKYILSLLMTKNTVSMISFNYLQSTETQAW